MKLKKIIILCLVLLIAATAVGCSQKNANTPVGVAKAFVLAYLEDDYIEMDKYSAVSQEAMMKDEMKFYMEEDGYTETEYWEDVADYYELDAVPTDYKDFTKLLKAAQKTYFEENFGKDYKLSVEAEESETLTGEELAEFLAELEYYEYEYGYFDIADIEQASAVSVEATLKSKELDDDRDEEYELLVVKINGNWKVLYVD